MPDITITDDQLARIDTLQDELTEAFVDTYGHVRRQDVIAYLLDTYTSPADRETSVLGDDSDPIAAATYPELQQVAADVPEVAGSGIDAAEMRGELIVKLGTVELAQRLQAIDEAEKDTDSTASEAPTQHSGDERSSTSVAASESADDTEAESATANPLSGMNKLLDEHAEQWRQSDSGDKPYEVELPDGTVMGARTKDDVKQLLFKHY